MFQKLLKGIIQISNKELKIGHPVLYFPVIAILRASWKSTLRLEETITILTPWGEMLAELLHYTPFYDS